MYFIAIVAFIALIISIYHDNRSILNPILLVVFLIFAYLSLTSLAYNSGWDLVYNILFGIGFLLLPLCVFLSGFFLIYNGIILLKKEGKSRANLLSLIVGLGIVSFYILMWLRLYYVQDFIGNPFVTYGFYFIVFSFILFFLSFFGFMTYSILYLLLPKRKWFDFIIIHGAGLLDGEKVTPLLEKRINKALNAYFHFSQKNTNLKIIASGGQGEDEKIAEATAIANYIKRYYNLSESVVLLEDKSETTYENLLYSKQIGDNLIHNPKYLFVTNDYHVFRTSLFAKKLKMKGDGLGCSTASYYIPSATIREFIASVVHFKWLFISFYLLFFIAILASL